MVDLKNWRSRNIRPELGNFQFSFAVIADTHVDREGEPSSSPFPVNELSNARTRFCIEDINRLKEELGEASPKFVLHMGDLIHPVPSMPSYSAAATDFFDIVKRLTIPLHLIPGNHDVGDKPVDWAPAGVVRDDFLTLWEQHFGDQYHAFTHDSVRFIMINAQIINSGLDAEHQQKKWLEKELKDQAGRRVMLCTHYPPFLTAPDETENYDNIGEPGRSWILNLLERHNIEAMFTGHVHHFWYNRFAETDCYLLPSTSFTRQDYSEMFRVAPSPDMQDGRNDVAKVGYFFVLVYENGHVCHLRRTDGMMLQKGEKLKKREPRIATYHTREIGDVSIGFDLRHPWSEVIEIAPSGALDEFHRKQMRNDYPLLSLWDMGVRKLRVPLHDLQTPEVRRRMRAMVHQGHQFTIISQGIPNSRERSLLTENHELITRWEVSIPLTKLKDALPALRAVQEAAPISIFLAKLRTKVDVIKHGEPYFHLISYGFVPVDFDELVELTSAPETRDLFSGFSFRIGRQEDPVERLAEIAELTSKLDISATVTIFMADNNPALHQCDDLANANRIAASFFAAAQFPNLDVFVDTYMDLDRGHSVRNGVIDRQCNPRLGLHVTRSLHAIICTCSERFENIVHGSMDDGEWIARTTMNKCQVLVLPNPSVKSLVFPRELMNGHSSGTATCADLETGATYEWSWQRNIDHEILLNPHSNLATPFFLSLQAEVVK